MDKVLHQLQSVRYALKCSELNLCQKFITGKCFRSACLPLQCSHCMPLHIGWCLVNTHFTSHHWIGKSIVSCVSCFICYMSLYKWWGCHNSSTAFVYVCICTVCIYVFVPVLVFSPVFAHTNTWGCLLWCRREYTYISGIVYVSHIVYCVLYYV